MSDTLAHVADPTSSPTPLEPGQVLDFLIVGAGVSGLGAACHMRRNFAQRSLAIIDTMEAPGGTWHTHRYPGVRSDSDLYTYGYAFKPWRGASIASGPEILRYLEEVIDEHALAPHIHYQHTLRAADWASGEQLWHLQIERPGGGPALALKARFLWMCAGYYDHNKPYTPDWPGLDEFAGRVVHPQHWPDDLDCSGQRVVVIGSGATAATLIPALAPQAAHVTMLQRSPTFFSAQPRTHELEGTLRALDVPDEWTHEIMRRAYVARGDEVVRMGREQADALRFHLIEQARQMLPPGFDVERHFSPAYRPWQQRIALVPDGDLFAAIRDGKASVVTDQIARIDARGVQLQSGAHLPADVLVTATGFNLSLFGDVTLSKDGQALDISQRLGFRGLMVEGVPNMAFVLGYFRFSWTLRLDLVCNYVTRILQHMAHTGTHAVQPRLRPEDANMPRRLWTEPDNFNPGYIQRRQHLMYGQGDRHPWRHDAEYPEERQVLGSASPQDSALHYA